MVLFPHSFSWTFCVSFNILSAPSGVRGYINNTDVIFKHTRKRTGWISGADPVRVGDAGDGEDVRGEEEASWYHGEFIHVGAHRWRVFAGPGRDIWQTLTYAPFCCPVIPAGDVRRVEIIAVDPRARLIGSCHLFLALPTTSSSSSSPCRTGSVVLLQPRRRGGSLPHGFPSIPATLAACVLSQNDFASNADRRAHRTLIVPSLQALLSPCYRFLFSLESQGRQAPPMIASSV